MHTLLILAHPSKGGFVRRVAEVYSEELRSLGHTSEILDLYAEEASKPYLDFQIPSETKADPLHLNPYQLKIQEADHLVFLHPLWWGMMPAILKNFIDVNFASGFAFTYRKWLAKGLLKGKTARVFVTGGGEPLAYLYIGFPFVLIWNVFILFYCGIWPRPLVYFGPKYGRTPENILEKWLLKTRMLAKKEAGKWKKST